MIAGATFMVATTKLNGNTREIVISPRYTVINRANIPLNIFELGNPLIHHLAHGDFIGIYTTAKSSMMDPTEVFPQIQLCLEIPGIENKVFKWSADISVTPDNYTMTKKILVPQINALGYYNEVYLSYFLVTKDLSTKLIIQKEERLDLVVHNDLSIPLRVSRDATNK